MDKYCDIINVCVLFLFVKMKVKYLGNELLFFKVFIFKMDLLNIKVY